MEYGRVRRFAQRHGSMVIMDIGGRTHTVPSGDPDAFELLLDADRFLWDGYWRDPREMEDLIAESERGLYPGCGECERLEQELIRARERDEQEGNLGETHALPALGAFKDHRGSH